MNYNDLMDKLIEKLKRTKYAVLAVSDKEGNISAPTMCIVNEGLTVYVQTDKKLDKLKSIKENSKVAINIGDCYFKGIAAIEGHPTKNKKFIELLKEKHPKTYKLYTNLEEEILIRIRLKECKAWEINEDKTVTTIDLVNKKVEDVVCKHL